MKTNVSEEKCKKCNGIKLTITTNYVDGQQCTCPPEETPKTNIWQACPLCHGYDNMACNSIMGTTNFRTCPVCNGKKIISTITGKPPIN